MTNKTETSINNNIQNKRFSFFASILVVIGSCIGAGIFFKSNTVLLNSQGSLILAIACWIIAAIAVVFMALALIEIVSVKNDDLSFIGWAKTFNSKVTFKAAKNFMFYLYLPSNFFYMPLYVLMSFQDGVGALINKEAFVLGTKCDWVIWSLVCIFMLFYFIFISGLYPRIGNIQNKIVTYIKFIPLVAVSLIGIILVGMNAGGSFNWGIQSNISIINSLKNGDSFGPTFPLFGMFLSISAIFFAYDGFYVVAGIQSEMKEPKKTPIAILIGLIIVTAVYLFIAITMSINGGKFADMKQNMEKIWKDSGRVIYGVINLMIAIGVLGILNGFSMWGPKFIEDLIREKEVPFWWKFKDKVNYNKPKIGVLYSFVLSLPLTLVFILIGGLGYIDQFGYGSIYGTGMDKLYSFADLVSTWTSLFVFMFIAMILFAGIKNRKTKKIQTVEKKYFLVSAWISLILVWISVLVTIITPFIDLFALSITIKEELTIELIVGRIMIVVTLFLFIFLSYGISLIEIKFENKKNLINNRN